MKIAFFGLGSIGKRHIRNIAGLLKKRGIDCQIDIYRHCTKEIEERDLSALINGNYKVEDLATNGFYYDIIFVTNPTSMHYSTIKYCVPFCRNMFIEKPVFENITEDIERLELRKDGVYYVACPMRYTSVLSYLKKTVQFDKVFSARAISSSYLPDWRPGQDYRDTYSAHKALGGGVAIDLIHEWDYLTSFFGLPNKVLYAGGKYSDLEIDSDDLATYIGVYDNRVIELHLDYFGRNTVRELVLYMADETIFADIEKGRIKYLKSGDIVDLSEDRDDYQCRELEHFLDIIDGTQENDSTVAHGLEVLKLAKGEF